MPTIEATVRFKTYVYDNETKGLKAYSVIKSRISSARHIQVLDFTIIDENDDPQKA